MIVSNHFLNIVLWGGKSPDFEMEMRLFHLSLLQSWEILDNISYKYLYY